MKSSTFLVLGLRWLDESIGRKGRSKEGKRARPLVGFSVFEVIFRLNALPNRVELKRCFVEHFKSYRTMCKVINFNGFKLVKNRSEKLKSLHLVDRWITWFHLLLRHQFIWKWSLNGLNAARHLINESCWQRCHLQQMSLASSDDLFAFQSPSQRMEAAQLADLLGEQWTSPDIH